MKIANRRSPLFEVSTWVMITALVVTSTVRVAVAETLTMEAILAEEHNPVVSPGSTSSAHDLTPVNDPRREVLALLNRTDVREEFRKQGVDQREVLARVESLSDEEVSLLASKIREAPAGGSAIGAVVTGIVVIFLVLLFTDILGLTKVFPFTRSVRK